MPRQNDRLHDSKLGQSSLMKFASNKCRPAEQIIQIVPVPDYLTPLLCFDESYPAYVDATSQGWSVLYALVNDEEEGHVNFYCMDSFGGGELGDIPVRLVPTVYCRKCGARMKPKAAYNLGPVEYTCICGAKYSEEAGWFNEAPLE